VIHRDIVPAPAPPAGAGTAQTGREALARSP
jgi:hypothetical protein